MNKIFSVAVLAAAALLSTHAVQAQQSFSPVPIEDGVAKISNENTAIQFVGIHVVTNEGDDTKPRLGGFQSFNGSIGVKDGAVASMNLEIDVTSLWTQFDKLTRHLKNADFFEVGEFGTASFESTSVEVDQLGKTNVIGNLTLHGTTKEVRFPIDATINDDGISLRSEFKLNRALFGMDKMTSGVEKVVSLTFVVGHETVVVAAGDDNPLAAPAEEAGESEPEVMESAVSMKLKLPNMT
jgi:polyisoprenoid-binding protein YceI